MKEKVIAVFDIGVNYKKLLLFDYRLNLVTQTEERFIPDKDDYGFECDNIDQIEKWIRRTVSGLIRSETWDLTAINFVTYGASLIFLDSHGRRLTPVYNYLKPVDSAITEKIYARYGGKDDFCTKTASPQLGMLNSGMQALWLKITRPEIFSKARHILHYPQYLSYLFTDIPSAEFTSIGYHTALWDFDKMMYHEWVRDEGFPVPDPISSDTTNEVVIEGKKIKVGIGLNNSSAALVPYYSTERGNFMLVSTGTTCTNMNPFNRDKLTPEQLSGDCYCNLSVDMKPVVCSVLFLGQLHHSAVKLISYYFKIQEESFKLIKPDMKFFNKLSSEFSHSRVFLEESQYAKHLKEEPDLFEFDHFVEAYHQLMIELSDLTVEYINLVESGKEDLKNLYLTGSFARNDLFVRLLASSFPHLKVYTAEINHSSALGAAMITLNSLDQSVRPEPDLGLLNCSVFR
jgi:sugar (pentulose or hexulose) kinase